MQAQTMIAMRDVVASSRWYQAVLGAASGHGGGEHEQIQDAAGRTLLQPHRWSTDDHPHLGDPANAAGNGVLPWFETPEFDAALRRIRELHAQVLHKVAVNPLAQHREIWLRAPDGHGVVIASPCGDTGGAPAAR
jgi:hypothetical protein